MLKPPSFAPNAKADVRGWRDPKTGELLVSRRHSFEDVQAYNMSAFPEQVEPAFKIIETITLEDIMADAPVEDTEEVLEPVLDELTKTELLDLAEERGVEVSKSWSKAKIIEALDGDA